MQGGNDGGGLTEGIAALNLTMSSIASPERPLVKPLVSPEVSRESLTNAVPELPAVEISKIPEDGPNVQLSTMVVDVDGWPASLLFEQESWALHAPELEAHNCKPGMRVIIAKAETHGPKTTPHTTYVMHIKTAFSIRGISRRYSDFKSLDRALRAVKRSAPALPRKKTFGKMSPKFITERKRQLQLYLDALLGDPTCAASEPFKMFLGAESHAAEMDILAKAAIRAADPLEGQAPVLNQWRGADAASLAGVEQAAEQAHSARNLPREARARSQLAVMYSNSGVKDKALEAARVAYTCCRQVQEGRGALAAGTLACCLTWASIHAAFGEYMLAHTRLREAEGLARGGAAPAALGLCLRMRALVHHAQGRPREAAEAAVAALPLLLEGGDFRTLALMQHGLGLVLLGAGEMRQAVEVLESALLFRRRSRDKLGLAETLAALGETFARIGYQLHAMDYFAQALALSQEVGDAAGESICLRSLGRVHHLHGDHSEALASYDRALTLLIRLDDLIGQSECHEGVAGIHLDLGDARMAIVHLKEARSLLSGPGDPHRVPSSGNTGASRDQDGEHEYPNSASSGEEEELSKEMGENRANQGGSAAGTENPRQGQGEREDLHRRLQEKLEAARKLQAETLNAYDEYDRALRQGPVGEVRSADSGGDGLAVPLPGGLASVGVGESAAGKGKSPRFPIKFKLKMPGQDFASHLKFLQSWSQHKRYYTGGAAGADEPDDES